MIAKNIKTEYGRRIWENVAKVAESCPEWMKDKVSKAARESAEKAKEIK